MSSLTVINEVQGAPQLSIGLPPIRLPLGVDIFLTAAAGVGISGGSSTNIVALARLKASLRESHEDVLDIEEWYYYPYAEFRFGGGSYRIPSIFMDLGTSPQIS